MLGSRPGILLIRVLGNRPGILLTGVLGNRMGILLARVLGNRTGILLTRVLGNRPGVPIYSSAESDPRCLFTRVVYFPPELQKIIGRPTRI